MCSEVLFVVNSSFMCFFIYFVNAFDGFSSGLAAAYKLKSKGVNVTVFEADGRVGGKLRSVIRNGLIWDEGANTMVVSCLLVS